MVKEGAARRVLVIAPSAFCMLWRARLEQFVSAVPVKLCYGTTLCDPCFEQSAGGSGRPHPVVAIIPSDAAMRAEVRSSLAASRWDMVILAEVQSRARCQPLDLYRQMYASGRIARSLLIAASPLDTGAEHETRLPKFHVTDWSGDLLDWDGNTIQLPPVRWQILEYCRSEEEIQFLNLLHEQHERSSLVGGPFRFETDLMVRRAASSPVAARRTLEIMGRKLSRASLHELPGVSERLHGDPTEVEDVPKLSFSPEARTSYLEFVQEAFQLFQQIPSDAKLDCLLGLLDELSDGRPGGICVLAAFAETVTYLHKALADRNRFSIAISGSLTYADRQLAMKDFVMSGGILLATPGSLGEESDLNRVKHVVHYDLPASRSQLAALEGRFGRINRTSGCRMYALQDLSGAVTRQLPIEQLIDSDSASPSMV